MLFRGKHEQAAYKAFEHKTTPRTALISRLDLSQTENSQIL